MAKKLIPAWRAFVMSRAAVRGLWEFTSEEAGSCGGSRCARSVPPAKFSGFHR
jgi:hypothetical protein